MPVHSNRGEMEAPAQDPREVLEFLQALLNEIRDPIFAKDEEHRWVYLNDRACEVIGESRENLLGRSDFDFFPAEQARVFWEKDDHVLRTGEPLENDEVITWHGQLRTIRTHKSLFRDPATGRGYVVGTIRDITEQRKAEEDLKASEERFSKAFRLTPFPLMLNRLSDGAFVEVNAAFEAATGYTREETIGQTPVGRGLVKQEDRSLIRRAIDRSGGFRDVEISFYTRSGERRLGIASGEAVSLNGQVHLLQIVQDITDRRREQEELHRYRNELEALVAERTTELTAANERLSLEIEERKRSEQAREVLIQELELKNSELERFAYTVSHDLKSPLVTISGFLELLDQSLSDHESERSRTNLERISGAVDRMRELLDDLLEFSRTGSRPSSMAEVPLGNLVSETLRTLEGTIRAGGVEVEVEQDLPTVRGDPGRLREALQNLIGNAVKYMGDQEAPRIRIFRRPDAVLVVEDNGRGIEPRYHQQIFKLFEQLDPSSEGTGVGLALVKRIVEQHGGRIWIESEGADQGSRFCIQLPAPRSD